MSYSIDICFKQLNNKDEAIFFAFQFIETLRTYSDEMLRLCKGCIPSRSKYMFEEKAYEMSDENRLWIYPTFNVTFFWWEKYNILGIRGLNYPKNCLDMVDSIITFQNGSDQNYDYEEWGNKIDLFNSIISKVKNIFDVDLLKNNGDNDLEYARKTTIYQEIFDSLDLGSFLYRDDIDAFVFTFSAIRSQKDELDISLKLRKLLYELQQEDEQVFGKIKR